jgi:uncharacterized protein
VTRIYVDSSAALKRVIAETHSESLVSALDEYRDEGAVLVSSSLAWIEVTRALLAHLPDAPDAAYHADRALSGIAEQPITPDAVNLARRIRPTVVRSLDAVHLASAILLDAHRVLTYDRRLALACMENGLTVHTPTQPPG